MSAALLVGLWIAILGPATYREIRDRRSERIVLAGVPEIPTVRTPVRVRRQRTVYLVLAFALLAAFTHAVVSGGKVALASQLFVANAIIAYAAATVMVSSRRSTRSRRSA